MNPDFKSLFAEVKSLENDPNGEFEAILSTKALDRDGESVAPGAFEPLPKSIPLYHHHDWLQKAMPVGSGEPYYDGDTLKIKGRFASTARGQEVRTLVREGHLPAMSVGFTRSQKAIKDGVQVISKAELFEGSFTGVPVNPTALVLAAKAMTGDSEEAAEAEVAQMIHDLSLTLGASCDSQKAMGHSHIHTHGRTKALTEGDSPVVAADYARGVVENPPVRHMHAHVHGDGDYAHMDDTHPHEHTHGKSVDDAENKDLTEAEGKAAAPTAEAVAEKATADAAGTTAGTEDDEELELRARLLQIEAEALAS